LAQSVLCEAQSGFHTLELDLILSLIERDKCVELFPQQKQLYFGLAQSCNVIVFDR